MICVFREENRVGRTKTLNAWTNNNFVIIFSWNETHTCTDAEFAIHRAHGRFNEHIWHKQGHIDIGAILGNRRGDTLRECQCLVFGLRIQFPVTRDEGFAGMKLGRSGGILIADGRRGKGCN